MRVKGFPYFEIGHLNIVSVILIFQRYYHERRIQISDKLGAMLSRKIL